MADDPGLTTEEVLRLMEEDELHDRVAQQTLASPIDYAKSRGIAPQKVYYWIRTKRLEKETCPCGRSCVNIEAADKVLKATEDAKKEIRTKDADET
jgi:hypothetical protein